MNFDNLYVRNTLERHHLFTDLRRNTEREKFDKNNSIRERKLDLLLVELAKSSTLKDRILDLVLASDPNMVDNLVVGPKDPLQTATSLN